MNKEETLALFARGRDAWNEWAEKMLAEKARLEQSGEWGDGQADAASQWREAANAMLSGHKFENSANFSFMIFPGDLRCVNTVFSCPAFFRHSIFMGGTYFYEAKFSHNVTFSKATFSDIAGFSAAEFSAIADFWKAKFSSRAFFNFAKFSGYTVFTGATFSDHTSFEGLIARTSFIVASTRFDEVPNFDQASFAEPPRLDRMHVRAPQAFGGRAPSPGEPDTNRAAQWRSLRRLAALAHDHERERDFFAAEIQALRSSPDRALPNLLAPLRAWFADNEGRHLGWRWKKGERLEDPVPFWPGAARYWFGVGYQLTSNFGRSMLRPFVLWLVATAIFAAIYLGPHATADGAYEGIGDWLTYQVRPSAGLSAAPALGCRTGAGSAVAAAVELSTRKGLLVFGAIDGSEAVGRLHECLYGARDGPAAIRAGRFGMAQSLLSAILLFLLLLAIRNQFRLRWSGARHPLRVGPPRVWDLWRSPSSLQKQGTCCPGKLGGI